MSHYRARPAVLPSERLILSPWARESKPRRLRALREAKEHDATEADIERAVIDGREHEARNRASTAPCPTFAVDPTATLPPTSQVFQYVPPPVKDAFRPILASRVIE